MLPEALRTFDQQYPGLRMVLYALLLILLMIYRPQGIMGRREISLAWFRRRSRGASTVPVPPAPTEPRPAKDETDV